MDKGKSIVLYPHGGSGNHGCEAIVRTTCMALNDKEIILYSSRKEEDILYGMDKICSIKNYESIMQKNSWEHLKLAIRYRLMGDKNAYEIIPYYKMLSNISRKDIAISIGGDNYCYRGMCYQMKVINKELDRKNISRILWGCSVEEENIKELSDDLKGYKRIYARESISYETLKRINANTYLYPDPAFLLEEKKVELPFQLRENEYVGINVSPMIIEHEKSEEIVFKNYINLVEYILKNTGMSIALIPHVVWKENNDLKVLNRIKEMYKDSSRVVIINDNDCMVQKYIISKSRFFVAARTHASIAAYSRQVPTLVVGYSVKAKGIAKDLFGSWDKYVLPVQNLSRETELVKNFQWLQDYEKDIKEKYRMIMPQYLLKAKQGFLDLRSFTEEL